MARRSLLPRLEIKVSMSEAFYDLVVGSGRIWNQHAREALQEELEKHHRERIPKHFRLGARNTYGYRRRRMSTERKKVRYWRKPAQLDLVRSGRGSLALMAGRQITFRGRFGGPKNPGTLKGMLNMWWPHPLRDNARVGGLSADELSEEVARTTADEQRDIAHGYVGRLISRIRQHRGPMRNYRPLLNPNALNPFG